MKKSDRFIALALCCTLTLGAFAYRPSEAKAIAGVDDAVVIGALLSAFAGGCGLIFSNNGMSSSELAQRLTDKWNEFNEAAESGASSFAAWLGFEDTSALLGALSFSGGKLVIPRAIARKFAGFTTWLVDNLGLTVGGDSVSLSGNNLFGLSNLTWSTDSSSFDSYFDYSMGATSFSARSKSSSTSTSTFAVIFNSNTFTVPVAGDYTFTFSGTENHFLKSGVTSSPDVGFGYSQVIAWTSGVGNRTFVSNVCGSFNETLTFYIPANSKLQFQLRLVSCPALSSQNFSWKFSAASANPAARLSVFAPSYYKTPTIDLPAEGEEAANPTLSGVGDGTATTIEGLLQQILEQLQANTLAPTLDLAGTETGGDTGTDEDAKPYLPYIPQIFEKIKELPGTLANIWETVKGIPAAIAEKIGAFFTTLWGWLQNIIDAITALPAAIAEKIGALFKPDEALVTEIVDAFKGKFGFLSTLNSFVNDLFSLTPESDPPVIWVHLENVESKYGYSYGDKQKILDLSWYQKYKASVDGILSGFLWLGYLWLLFKRAPGILNGMSLANDDAPRSADMPDMLNTPRLGAGDGSTMYRGDGFTMRDKGRRGK